MFFIYRLTDGEQDYYGQTEDPERRFGEHKKPSCRCRSKLLDKSKMKIHIIFRLYTQEEADEIEAFYQLNFDCVNSMITGRTKQEWYETNKEEQIEYNKKHREENKEYYKEYKKQHYKDNKEKYQAYNQENKETIAERKKKYFEENKEHLVKKKKEWGSTIKECECGSKYTLNHKQRHIKSKKHQNYISSIKQE